MSVEIQTKPELTWSAPRLAFETDFVDTNGRSFDVTSDGQKLYVIKQPNPPDGSRVNVITNWRGQPQPGLFMNMHTWSPKWLAWPASVPLPAPYGCRRLADAGVRKAPAGTELGLLVHIFMNRAGSCILYPAQPMGTEAARDLDTNE